MPSMQPSKRDAATRFCVVDDSTPARMLRGALYKDLADAKAFIDRNGLASSPDVWVEEYDAARGWFDPVKKDAIVREHRD
jgi:hypothetical protein